MITICAAWLFKANDERLIVQIIGTVILFGGSGFYAIKMLFEQ
jgi:hypothetical protein